jgi:hypothetical protein
MGRFCPWCFRAASQDSSATRRALALSPGPLARYLLVVEAGHASYWYPSRTKTLTSVLQLDGAQRLSPEVRSGVETLGEEGEPSDDLIAYSIPVEERQTVARHRNNLLGLPLELGKTYGKDDPGFNHWIDMLLVRKVDGKAFSLTNGPKKCAACLVADGRITVEWGLEVSISGLVFFCAFAVWLGNNWKPGLILDIEGEEKFALDSVTCCIGTWDVDDKFVHLDDLDQRTPPYSGQLAEVGQLLRALEMPENAHRWL